MDETVFTQIMTILTKLTEAQNPPLTNINNIAKVNKRSNSLRRDEHDKGSKEETTHVRSQNIHK